MDDDKGTSVVLINSVRGRFLWENIQFKVRYKEVTLEQSSQQNLSMLMPFKENLKRDFVLEKIKEGNIETCEELFTESRVSIFTKIKRNVKYLWEEVKNKLLPFRDGTGEYEYMKQNRETTYHTHISSVHNWYDINLREVWKYRDLIILFTKRNFILTFKQTILGPIWIFLNPFITSIIFTIVFGGIAGISTNGVPQILFYLSSNALWGFFSECVSRNASTFVTNAAVFGKIYFPRITVPISNAISSMIRFMIQMVLILVFFLYYVMKGMVCPNWLACLFLPLVLIQLGMLGIGVGIIVSSLTTKYRDLMIVVGFGISLWMYATPIVYPLSQISGGVLKTIVMINPVTMPVELFRYAVLGQGVVVFEYYTLSWLITIIVAISGMILFTHVEKTFMDTV